ncbi:hypothetical protein [Chitinophaga sp. Ak27]
MYIHNIVSRPLRPVNELKGFKKVFLNRAKLKQLP